MECQPNARYDVADRCKESLYRRGDRHSRAWGLPLSRMSYAALKFFQKRQVSFF